MSEPKSFASLDPVLLARKGTAKPAMRAQLGANDRTDVLDDDLAALAAGQAELGWNDMGPDHPLPVDNVVTLEGARSLQGNLARRMNVSRDRKPTAGRSASSKAHRAAFTLRLDPERHLKMRLAATIKGLQRTGSGDRSARPVSQPNRRAR